MERREHFGRRAAPQRASDGERPAAARPLPVSDPEPTEFLEPVAAHLDLYATDAEVDREVEEWKTRRKLHKRSFREPWRSFAIACSIAFGIGNLVLPDSVATIMNYVTFGLGLASIIAGYRRPRG